MYGGDSSLPSNQIGDEASKTEAPASNISGGPSADLEIKTINNSYEIPSLGGRDSLVSRCLTLLEVSSG